MVARFILIQKGIKMRRVLWSVLIAWPLTVSLWARDEPQKEPTTPQQRYQTLQQEHETAEREFWAKWQKIRTPDERRTFFKEHYPQPKPYIRRFWEICDSAPAEPAAADALIWIVMHGGCDPEVNRAVERLAAKHADSRRLGEISPRLIPNLIFSASTAADRLFHAIIAKNPDRVAQGRAYLALANYLKREADLVRAMKGDTPQARQLVSFYQLNGFDEVSLNALRAQDADDLIRRSEAMRARAARDYADVSDILSAEDPTAEDRLWEDPRLGVGRPAPEIDRTDLDGKPLKLSAYKGRVVVLLFWGDWSRPCRAMYAQARSLVQKMGRQPFVLLGVNSDKDKAGLTRRIAAEKIPWRSWWDGGGAQGRIATEFHVAGWPAVYILDHHGVIRAKWVGSLDDRNSNTAGLIDELTAAASRKAPSSTPDSR